MHKYYVFDGVKGSRNISRYEDYPVDPRQFYNVTSAQVSYLLGFIWGDGSIRSIDNVPRSVFFSIQAPDYEYLKPILEYTGNWRKTYKKCEKWQDQIIGSTNNRHLGEYLKKNDYHIKSGGSPEKILSTIPEHLKRYWFQGLIDADGCFYIHEKYSTFQFHITSSFTQDWKYMEDLFKKFNMKYQIQRKERINENGNLAQSSVIRTSSKGNIKKLYDFLYPNGYEFGYKRKYDICKRIVDKVKPKIV